MKSSKPRRATAAGRAATTVVATQQPVPAHNIWPLVIGGFAALITVFTIYGPSMSGPFLMDDDYLAYTTPAFYSLPWTIWVKSNRPLLMFTYWMNFELSGPGATYSYHFFNVLLHSLNCLWIFLAVRKLLERAGTREWTREAAAIFTAALFLVHPLQTESVSYIASRSETLSVCFFLASFVVFLYGLPRPSVPRIAGILALFGAACLSKEHTVILPALLLLTDYYWNPGFSLEGIKKNWRLYVPIALLGAAGVALVFLIVFNAAAISAGFNVKGVTWYQYFFTECRVIWRYVFLFIFPFSQNLDPDIPFSHNLIDHGALAALLALLAASAAAWMWRRRFPLASYGWFVFLLLLAPTSSIVPIADPSAERRLYLPFIGLLLIVAELVRRWNGSPGTVVGTLCAVLALAAFLTYQRNELYGSTIAIWKDTVDKSPHKRRPAFQYAFALYSSGRCGDAVTEFARTATLEKPSYDLLVDWGLAAACAGRKDEAIQKLRQAAALEPNAYTYSQLGLELLKQSKLQDAMTALNEAIQRDSNYAPAYTYRGKTYELLGDYANGIRDYQHALAIDPANQEARDSLRHLGR